MADRNARSSPYSGRSQGFRTQQDPYRASGRRSFNTSSNESATFSRALPMSINTPRAEEPPPPLPPPPLVADLSMNRDPGWHFQNQSAEARIPANVPKTSSLAGAFYQRERRDSDDFDSPLPSRKDGWANTDRNIPSFDSFSFDHADEGYGSLSGTSIVSQSV